MTVCPKDGYTLRSQSQNGNVRNLVCPHCGTEYIETFFKRPAASVNNRAKAPSIFIEPKSNIMNQTPRPRKKVSKQKAASSSPTKTLARKARKCDIKCPVHNIPLTINARTLKIAGQFIDFVTGTCPNCKQVYLGEMPVRGATTFEHTGIRYEFLNALSKQGINEAEKEARRQQAAEQMARSELLRQQKEERKLQEAEKRARAREKRAAKEAARKEQQVLDQEARYADYQNNPDKLFRAFYTAKSETPLTHCMKDHRELLFLKTSQYSRRWACPYCGTVYMGWYETKSNAPKSPKPKVSPSHESAKSKQAQKRMPSIPDTIRNLPDKMPEYNAPDLVAIIGFTAERLDGARYITIVNNDASQNTAHGIYWIRRTLAKDVLLAVTLGKKSVKVGSVVFSAQLEKAGPMFTRLRETTERFSPSRKPVTVYLFAGKEAMGEKIEVVTALIFFPDINDYVPMTVYHDSAADLYFMNEGVYNEYAKKYGLPYLTVSRIKSGSELGNINAASELFQLGYSVAKTAGLDAATRHRLLVNIIDTGKLSQSSISSHLEYLLRLHGGDARYADACEKWQQDLNFVLDYNAGNRRTVYGDLRKHL